MMFKIIVLSDNNVLKKLLVMHVLGHCDVDMNSHFPKVILSCIKSTRKLYVKDTIFMVNLREMAIEVKNKAQIILN